MPAFPSMPTLPQLPALDDSRAPNAVQRSWLLGQLPSFAQQNSAAVSGIGANARLGLAGYGGWSVPQDNPDTAEREDVPAFSKGAGPGEREKSAFRGEVNQANARGMLHSSFTNQNIASAAQRLSLEAQQIVNQYSQSIIAQQTGYANQVAGVIGTWVGLYGSDAQYLADNPPPTPAAAAPPEAAPTQYAQSARGESIVWKGSSPPNMATLRARHPGANIVIRRAGGGGYVAVLA